MTVWSEDEAALLDRLAGEVPWPEVVRRFQRYARRMGWPVRSDRALALRAARCGHPCRSRMGQWLTTYGAAELLGCRGDRVAAWANEQTVGAILQPVQVGRIRYISRASWRRLAQQRPDVLGGFSADALFLLLEDRELADDVAARHPIRRGDWRVRCLETGQIWPSCAAAAREFHVTPGAISVAIRRRRKLAAVGLTFEALRKV